MALVMQCFWIEAVEDENGLKRGNELRLAPAPNNLAAWVEFEQLPPRVSPAGTVALPVGGGDVATGQDLEHRVNVRTHRFRSLLHGADALERDSDGYTALDQAVQNREAEAI